MNESQLLGEILWLAGQLGLLAHHCADPVRCQGQGFPDLVITGPRGILFAELKGPRGRLRRDQWAWRHAVLAASGSHVVWTPADWESGRIADFLRFLAGNG